MRGGGSEGAAAGGAAGVELMPNGSSTRIG